MKNIFLKKLFIFAAFLSMHFVFANPVSFYEDGLKLQMSEDWHGAIEMYQSALQENPSYSLAFRRLAECFYAVDEYDQALSFAEKAYAFKKNDIEIENLKGFILIGLGKLEEAQKIFKTVLRKYPNNPEAAFGSAEIEAAEGRLSSAASIYGEALRRQPENRKALLSLAILSYEAGNIKIAEECIKKALKYHGDNPLTLYFAAYLKALTGKNEEAEAYLLAALKLKPEYEAAKELLGSVLYAQKRYSETIEVSDKRIAANRNSASAWYVKTLSLLNLKKTGEALQTAKIALSLEQENEVTRFLLEEIAIEILDFENTFRKELSKFHAEKALGFERKNMNELALFEYRRALKVYPYDAESRASYARLLLRKGCPERYLEQLEFIQSIAKSTPKVNDAVESYGKILQTSLMNKWKIDPLYLDKAHISIGLFFESDSINSVHPEAERIVKSIAADIFSYDRRLKINDRGNTPSSYIEAFKKSRTAGDDYFGILKLRETNRDVQLLLELYVSRTGSPAKTFTVYRSGNSRYTNAVRRLSVMLSKAMPVAGTVLDRRQKEIAADIGKHDTEFENAEFLIIKKGGVSTAKEGLGLIYDEDNLLGLYIPQKTEEDISEGTIKEKGFFDRINKGDSILLKKEQSANDEEAVIYRNSFLLNLLRKVR